MLEVTDTTNNNGQFVPPVGGSRSSLAAGWYVIEAITKDKYGELVKDIQYVQLYNKGNSINPLAFGRIEAGKTVYKPGETVNYQLTTNLDSVFLIHNIVRKDVKEERRFTTLNRNSVSFEIPVTENDRGGLGVQIAFVKHNRSYSDNVTLQVPYTNKELAISYTTYRDKTLPGSAEKWKVKISGFKGDQVAAEILTGMYDASLDQFGPHNWQQPDLWSNFFFNTIWSVKQGFQSISSEEMPQRNEQEAYFLKEYDWLITGLKQVLNEDGTFRDLASMSDHPESWIGKPRMLTVPDLNADPDGSKGIMRDTITISGSGWPI